MRKHRQDSILEILKRQHYATVKELCELLHYSPASIYRDLNHLQAIGLVKRHYGGVELAKKSRIPSLPLRYDFMKKEKRHLGRAAAALVNDGDTVFIDGSTTAESMGQFLTEKKNLRVITSNLRLALFLGEYDIEVICLGGTLIEKPSMLGGSITVTNANRHFANKAFFSTGYFSAQGRIGSTSENFHALHVVMLQNANKSYYLADHSKLSESLPHHGFSFSEISGIICDYDFDERVKAAFPNTEFLFVED